MRITSSFYNYFIKAYKFMKKKKLSFTTRYVLLFGVLLVVTNLILGVVILNQSKNAMRSLINKNM